MKTTPTRGFTIVDAMILAAATAGGCAWFRAVVINSWSHDFPESWHERIAVKGILATSALLMAWSAAFLVIRLRQPRPRFRRLARQPGMVACSAATVAILYQLLWMLLVGMKWGLQTAYTKGYLPSGKGVLSTVGAEAELWVAGAWLALALGGRWRSERSWIDRLGRILGLTWIMVKVIRIILGYLRL
jgi:hypothetical protein